MTKNKQSKLPSAGAMKKFAKLFTKEQWERCTEQSEFNDLVTTDLFKAQNVAIQILNDRYEE